MHFSSSTTLLLASLASLVLAHPHPSELSDSENARRELFQHNARRSLSACQNSLKKRDGVADRGVARRMAFAEQIRRSKGLKTGMQAFSSFFKSGAEDLIQTSVIWPPSLPQIIIPISQVY